tara:strand:- start:968 stop:1195 length:228 start_codon:yes stop_codon:yes gene_type:complete
MKQRLTTKYFKKTILVSAMISAISANAEQTNIPAKDDSEDVERIMITASKRLKGLQESPVAVTVVSSQAIEQANY